MKLIQKTLIAAACASTLLIAGNAFAADIGTLDVTGTVVGECKFGQTGHYVMSFGTLSPSAMVDAHTSVPTDVTYRCTMGTAPTLFTIGGNSAGSIGVNIADSAGHTLPVALTWTPPTTLGLGFVSGAATLISIPVSGNIPFAAINAAPAAIYSNITVALSITP